MVDLRTNEERYGCNLFLCLGLKQLLGTWPNRLKTVGLHGNRPMHEDIQRCNCKEYSSQRRRKSVFENRKEPCRTSCNAIAINVMTRRLDDSVRTRGKLHARRYALACLLRQDVGNISTAATFALAACRDSKLDFALTINFASAANKQNS